MKRPLLIGCLFYIAGILIGWYVGNGPAVVISAAAVLLCTYWTRARGYIFYAVVFGMVLIFGAVYAQYKSDIGRSKLAQFVDKTSTIEGIFIEEVKRTESSIAYLLTVNKINDQKVDNEKTRVTIYGNAKQAPDFKYGDILKVHGQVELPTGQRNPGGFDYRKYLMGKGIYAIVSANSTIEKLGEGGGNVIVRKSLDFKNNMLEVIDSSLPERQTALLEGIVLSKTDSLDDTTKNNFSNSGLSHLMAASGMNVAFVVLPLIFIFKKLRIKELISCVIITFALIIFTIITGSSPSVVRAVIMSLVVLYGKLMDRQGDVVTSLAFSALLILLYNPFTLFDIGFQLSYAATISIVLFYSKIKGLLSFLPKYLNETISVTLSAQLGVTPIIIYYFNKLSLISLISNVLAAPLAGITLVLGLVMSLLGQIHIFFAQILAGLNYLLLSLLLLIADKSVQVPYSTVSVSTPKIFEIAIYYLVLLITVFFWPQIKERVSLKTAARLGVSLSLVLVLCAFLFSRDLEVSFLDVGQGESIFIKTPQNKVMLIDSGSSNSSFDVGEKVVTPFLLDKGVRKIDIIVLSHTDGDHTNGLKSIVKSFKVGTVILGEGIELEKHRDIAKLFFDNGIKILRIKPGGRVDIEENIYLSAFEAKEQAENDKSLVVRLNYKNKRFLFTGDISSEAEKDLLKEGELKADVLKVAHHGSGGSSSDEFLDAVKPEVAVISVGKNNVYGHPAKQTLSRLVGHGSKIFRTDENGCVSIFTNGDYLQVKTMNGDKMKL